MAVDTRFFTRTALALSLLLSSVLAMADPPGRIGRLSDVQGQVWLYSPDAGEWITADVNRPLSTSDRLSTDANGRADVRIGSTTVRIDSGTELEFVAVDDERIGLQLHGGSVAVRLRQSDAARQFDLATVEGRFRTQRAGSYRFDRDDGISQATVTVGQVLYEGAGTSLTLDSGQRAEFRVPDGRSAQYAMGNPLRDQFSDWVAERDRNDERTASTQYVSPEMTGVEDLDRYGRWSQDPEYGALWAPRDTPEDWAPYNAGHWVYRSPWGWTWIDDARWGFAPFHYGRWVYVRNSWFWAPGTYVARPVYAPALVGWVGGPGLNVSVNVGGPPVGWFPLAPREVYVPGYRVSSGYVSRVNYAHVPNIPNLPQLMSNPQGYWGRGEFHNRQAPRGLTIVPPNIFIGRLPVGPAAHQWRDRNPRFDDRNDRRDDRRGGPPQNIVLIAPPVPLPGFVGRRPDGRDPGQRPPPSPVAQRPFAPRFDGRRDDVVTQPLPMSEGDRRGRDGRDGRDPRDGRDARDGRDGNDGERRRNHSETPPPRMSAPAVPAPVVVPPAVQPTRPPIQFPVQQPQPMQQSPQPQRPDGPRFERPPRNESGAPLPTPQQASPQQQFENTRQPRESREWNDRRRTQNEPPPQAAQPAPLAAPAPIAQPVAPAPRPAPEQMVPRMRAMQPPAPPPQPQPQAQPAPAPQPAAAPPARGERPERPQRGERREGEPSNR